MTPSMTRMITHPDPETSYIRNLPSHDAVTCDDGQFKRSLSSPK